MKKIYSLLLFINIAFCFAQTNKKLTVDYTLFMYEDEAELNSPRADIMRNVYKESGNVYFKLYVKDSISYYIENNGIASSKLSTQFAIGSTQYNTPIYYTNKENTFSFKNNPGFIFFDTNEFLIQKKGITNWNISNESKIIDGKICYKATANDYYYHSNSRKVDYQITAWFCPQIPLKFGPVYYNNLPGLIVEISYLNIKLVATKISFELNEKNIIKPFGKKKVTVDEYDAELSNKIREMTEAVKEQQGKN